MTPGRLLLLSVLLLAAGYGLWRLSEDAETPSGIELPEAGEDAFLSGNPALVDRITVEHPRYGQRVRAELGTDARWRLSEPLIDLAEPAAIQAVMIGLWSKDWQAPPETWLTQDDAQLGLAEPALICEVRYRDGSVETVIVGAPGPGGRLYACRHDGELVALGKTAVVQLERPASQWRDHRVNPFGIGVRAVEWQPTEGAPLVLELRGNRWTLLAPVEGPLDEGAVPFLARMLGSRAEAIGDSPPLQVEGRLPIGLLTLGTGDGREVVLELWSAGVMSNEREYLLSVLGDDFQFLSLDVEQLLSRRLLDFDPGQVQSIRAEHGGREKIFRQSTLGWLAAGAQEYDQEVGVMVAALLDYAIDQKRTERLPVPGGPPSGRLLYSISRTPIERGSAILRWWTDPSGRVLVGAGGGDFVTPTSINFELGVAALLDRFD